MDNFEFMLPETKYDYPIRIK